jgi:hypothetical protein
MMTQTKSLIFGVVKDPNGNPVLNARVSFTAGPVPLPDIAALTDTMGSFTLSAPAPGEYVIEVVSDEFVKKREKINVENNQEKHLEIALSRS